MKKRKWTYRLLVKLPLLFIALSFALVLLLRYVPVMYTPLMLKRTIQNREVETFETRHTWVSLDQISPQLAKAVVLTEDQKFYDHHGFDWDEIKKMRNDHLNKGTKLRGCSTISQQTAKNVFSFGSRTGIRKVWEAYWTVLIELLWSKDRIMEVYLNVIEMGPGIYGAEAAAQQYFGCPASKLTRTQAVSIAICLPNPLKSNPAKLTPYQRSRCNRLLEQMQ
ncbi:MAG: monofunctional biosynthetic peptidoglycan transglycosylase [Bacteroidaceae bacterium]|nr:monofunctional biosynthetic peptidoglycan transglycosylase [Bacteroidaceae bacterium]